MDNKLYEEEKKESRQLIEHILDECNLQDLRTIYDILIEEGYMHETYYQNKEADKINKNYESYKQLNWS